MIETKNLFEDRKAEVNSLFQEIVRMDESLKLTSDSDREEIFGILKSSFALMLYNLIEACIKQGFNEVYDAVKNYNATHKNLTPKFVDRWIEKVIRDNRDKPEYYLKIIINQLIASPTPLIELGSVSEIKGIADGNLDRRSINKLLETHGIRPAPANQGSQLVRVKDWRNKLSHGEVSFRECMRENVVSDLENVMLDVFRFMNSTITNIEDFYNRKHFLDDSEIE